MPLRVLRPDRRATSGCASWKAAAAGWRSGWTKFRAALARTRERVDDYTLELQRHGLESVEREVRWLNELIETSERTPAPAERHPTRPHSTDRPDDTTESRHREHRMGSVRVAIVGVGNCAASLVQGVEYYKDADPQASVPGLMHVQFGDYHVRDVEFVAAFDVDAKKVGLDLADAIGASENNTIKICDVPPTGVTVQRGHTLDGLGKYYRETIEESDDEPGRRRPGPQGHARSTSWSATCPSVPRTRRSSTRSAPSTPRSRFVNALPVFIAGTKEWADKFTEAGVPIVGDDIKSQVGATITHRVLAKLFEDRGVDPRPHLPAERRRQHGLQEHARARPPGVQEDLQDAGRHLADPGPRPGARNVHIGPSDYVPWLDDRKWAYVRLEGRAFGDVPLNLEYKLEVWDSPNSAGVIIDALRCREDRQGPRHRRPDPLGVVVLHEVPAGAVRRRRGARPRREVHRGRGRALSPAGARHAPARSGRPGCPLGDAGPSASSDRADRRTP